jgi:hypothetical protein
MQGGTSAGTSFDPRPRDRAKVECVRAQLATRFPNVRITVRDFGAGHPIAFLLRWIDGRDARIRIARDRLSAYERVEGLLPAQALHALELGQSVLVGQDEIVIESGVE